MAVLLILGILVIVLEGLSGQRRGQYFRLLLGFGLVGIALVGLLDLSWPSINPP